MDNEIKPTDRELEVCFTKCSLQTFVLKFQRDVKLKPQRIRGL